MAKVFKGFRFSDEMYGQFKRVVEKGNITVTEAFERFMASCIDAECLVYYEKRDVDCEVEARVFIDWLDKGKYFYHAKTGEEVSVQGELIDLLHKTENKTLKKDIEECLKNSVKATDS